MLARISSIGISTDETLLFAGLPSLKDFTAYPVPVPPLTPGPG
jgi:hypothetical protein